MKYYQVTSIDTGKQVYFTTQQASHKFGKEDWQHIRKGRVPSLECIVFKNGLPEVSTNDSKRIAAKLELEG